MFTQAVTTQLEWFASMQPIEHKVDNAFLRKTYVQLV